MRGRQSTLALYAEDTGGQFWEVKCEVATLGEGDCVLEVAVRAGSGRPWQGVILSFVGSLATSWAYLVHFSRRFRVPLRCPTFPLRDFTVAEVSNVSVVSESLKTLDRQSSIRLNSSVQFCFFSK